MNKLFYFSGTGNSLWTARTLAALLPDFDIQPIGALLNGTGAEGIRACDAIGFVFPVYLYGPPLVVRRLFSSLNVTENQYLFCIAVHGGYLANTLTVTGKLLAKNKGHQDMGAGLKMPGNCIIDYDPPAPEIINARIVSCTEKIARIADAVKNRERGTLEKGNPAAGWFLTGVLHTLLIGTLPGYAKKFHAESTCTSCGTCRAICPVSNIEMHEGRPVWGGNCEMCLACIQHCPAEAIQWGSRTKKRKRYRNPQVSIQDLKQQQVSMQAE